MSSMIGKTCINRVYPSLERSLPELAVHRAHLQFAAALALQLLSHLATLNVNVSTSEHGLMVKLVWYPALQLSIDPAFLCGAVRSVSEWFNLQTATSGAAEYSKDTTLASGSLMPRLVPMAPAGTGTLRAIAGSARRNAAGQCVPTEVLQNAGPTSATVPKKSVRFVKGGDAKTVTVKGKKRKRDEASDTSASKKASKKTKR